MNIEIIDNKELPNYADFLQLIIGSLGIIATVITLYKLMKKDKERLAEIASLSTIAEQLKDMMQLNEATYRETKYPHLIIECKINRNYNRYFLHFKNTNPTSRITKYIKEGNDILGIASQIEVNGNAQIFSFSIPVNREPYSLKMNYIVENKFKFEQSLFIYKEDKTYKVQGLQIKYIPT